MSWKIFFVIFTFFIMVGCYTVIKHPPISETGKSNFQHHIYFSDDCGSCHKVANQPFNLTPREQLPRLNYIYSNDRWYYYYESPWWSRDVFYQTGNYPENSTGNSTLPTTSARRRFPGAGGNNQYVPSNPVSSGGTVQGSSTRISTKGNSSSNDSSSSNKSNVSQRKKTSSTRDAQRGKGDDNTGSNSSRKVKRKKK